ncbi:L-histidine N(alpha)-methyltransferase [Prolixibacter sp. NT017]|uniref:L-histidine N(alpha)-methyltransferase n=1 Tax=Prolixibacter sp. NT017 TaxID=2652390 RepID=UPI00126DB5DF|nr:L-histidine N(alpha)-methyltransferase [Prolixibacter sp. NT017]GET24413.1 dimethylhistidine N-methyltransferase [Prolixibacter sp. NT017]
MEQQTLITDIAADTLKGLSSNPKYLLSKYFYDDAGSAIFQDIMNMPEYYLTDCEHEIFLSQKEEITLAICPGNKLFNLVELGSGDGLKTKILLKHMVEKGVNFQYTPVDISAKANNELVESLKTELPALLVEAKTGDYFRKLKNLNGHASIPKIILFLGSNIGNFSDKETDAFLNQLSAYTNSGDKVLIGFDLKKSPKIIMDAYNDPHGHTRRFNLNHLVRLNRELDSDFDITQFEQHTIYDPKTGDVKSYLVSKTEQKVHVGAIEQDFYFRQWETIFMERSRKFDLSAIEKLAEESGFKVVQNFTDKRNYFVDSLWIKD